MTVKKMFLFFIQRNKNNGDLVKFLKIYNLTMDRLSSHFVLFTTIKTKLNLFSKSQFSHQIFVFC